MPLSSLQIAGEHFQEVNHSLPGVPGTGIKDLAVVHAHVRPLGQYRKALRRFGVEPASHADADTVGANHDVTGQGGRPLAPLHGRIPERKVQLCCDRCADCCLAIDSLIRQGVPQDLWLPLSDNRNGHPKTEFPS